MDNLKNSTIVFYILFLIIQAIGITCVFLMFFWINGSFSGFDDNTVGFIWFSNPFKRFDWHPFILTLYIYISANALLIFRSMRILNKKIVIYIHAAMQTVLLVFLVMAQTAVFDYPTNSKPSTPNMYSLHSWIGLTTTIVYGLQWLVSIPIYLYPQLPCQKELIFWHVFIGLFIFILAIISCITGLVERAIFKIKKYQELPLEGVIVNMIGILLGLFGVLVLYLATEKKFRRPILANDPRLLSWESNLS